MTPSTVTTAADRARTHQQVQDYYGRKVRNQRDLRTRACCPIGAMRPEVQAVLDELEPEIKDKFYGCGSPIPMELAGMTVLDLGCGTGRDVYLASKLAGPAGRVIGVDMTEAQLEVARRYVEPQMRRFGFARPNVAFHYGCIEDLKSLDIEDESVDVVMSNCVINLSPDKSSVFSEIFRVLKAGGELCFSDIFADRRIPCRVADDPVLRGECLGGAMYIEDFRRLLADLGCPDYRVLARRRIELDDPQIQAQAGMIGFESLTVRAFKLADLEDICEDYGQLATYLGTIAESPHRFVLDDHHTFETGRPATVCGNTAAMLAETRYAPHFRVQGTRETHYGRFDCSAAERPTTSDGQGGSSCC